MFGYEGVIGLILLVLFIYATLKIADSDASTVAKAIWIVIILCLPILGFIAWLLIGPSSPAKR